MKIKNILFVCTGNSCRSVMAEGLLKKMLSDKKHNDLRVHSCGIAALSEFSPTANTIQVMKNEGINVSDYKTTGLSRDLINKSDLILVMEKIHKDEVIRLVPEADGKTYLLKEFVREKADKENFSVPDPIGKPLEVYERVLNTIKEAIQKLVEKI